MDKFSVFEKITVIIDGLRIFPRLLILSYNVFFLYCGFWFMGLSNPTPEQAAFVSVIIGAGTAWFGLYINSGDSRKGVE